MLEFLYQIVKEWSTLVHHEIRALRLIRTHPAICFPVFTARCSIGGIGLVQSTVLRSHVVCPIHLSVCLSVRPSVRLWHWWIMTTRGRTSYGTGRVDATPDARFRCNGVRLDLCPHFPMTSMSMVRLKFGDQWSCLLVNTVPTDNFRPIW